MLHKIIILQVCLNKKHQSPRPPISTTRCHREIKFVTAFFQAAFVWPSPIGYGNTLKTVRLNPRLWATNQNLGQALNINRSGWSARMGKHVFAYLSKLFSRLIGRNWQKEHNTTKCYSKKNNTQTHCWSYSNQHALQWSWLARFNECLPGKANEDEFSQNHLPSLKLTACPWKWMFGILDILLSFWDGLFSWAKTC